MFNIYIFNIRISFFEQIRFARFEIYIKHVSFKKYGNLLLHLPNFFYHSNTKILVSLLYYE